jgi:hypothetical protein
MGYRKVNELLQLRSIENGFVVCKDRVNVQKMTLMVGPAGELRDNGVSGP